jgi:hypothetical protein
VRRPRRTTPAHTRRSSSTANERKFWGSEAAVTSALSGITGRQSSAGGPDATNGADGTNGTTEAKTNGANGAHGKNAGQSSDAGLPVEATADPTAMIRSLGPPPLAGHETVAEHYFAAVYEKAVGLAGALAVAAGLTATTTNGGTGADTGTDDDDPADD